MEEKYGYYLYFYDYVNFWDFFCCYCDLIQQQMPPTIIFAYLI